MITKFRICVVLVLLITSYSVAQDGRIDPISPPERVYVFKSYQALAGLNVNYGYGDDFDFLRSQLRGKQMVKHGWRVGIGATHQFLPTIDFQSMLLLEQKGWKTEVSLPLPGSPIEETQVTNSTLNYATFVFRSIYRPKKLSRLFIGFGAYGARLVKAKGEQTRFQAGRQTSSQIVYGGPDNREFDFGLTPSVGYMICRKEKIGLELQFSNYFGLVDTTNPEARIFSRYNNSFAVSLITSFQKPVY